MTRRRQDEKSKIFAAIMAIFFGGFGVHKFYLKDTGAGFLYIFIFFMTTRFFPISYILGWIDAFRLLTMSQETFDKKYNKNVVRDVDYYETDRRTSRQSRQTASRRDRRRSRDRVVRAAPTPRAIQKANPFKKSGLKKYKEFDLEGAIEDFEQGLTINPNDVALHFNMACAYSLTEKKEKSFHHLSKAVSLGYNDFTKIKTHDDLAFLRIQPEFEEFKNNNFVLSSAVPAVEGGDNPTAIENNEVKDDVLLSQLNKLAELRKKGLLTEDEFVLERKKLLRR